MKRIIASLAILMLVCVTSVWAAPVNPDIHDVVAARQTIQDQRETIRQDVQDTHQAVIGNLTAGHEYIEDQREAMGTFIHQSRVTLAQDVTGLRSQIETEREANQARIANLTGGQRATLEHMYDSQAAAHALMEMQGLLGDIGPRVTDIAGDLNASAGVVQPLEERIQDRNAFVRFFVGGDRDAADQINDQVAQNQLRIENLTELMQGGNLQPDVQQAMQEQITALQQQQANLSGLAGSERNSTGLFGWLLR